MTGVVMVVLASIPPQGCSNDDHEGGSAIRPLPPSIPSPHPRTDSWHWLVDPRTCKIGLGKEICGWLLR